MTDVVVTDAAFPDVAAEEAAARGLGIETIHYGPGVDLQAEFVRREVLPAS